MTLQQLKAQIQEKDPTDAPTYAEMLALIEIVEQMQPNTHQEGNVDE